MVGGPNCPWRAWTRRPGVRRGCDLSEEAVSYRTHDSWPVQRRTVEVSISGETVGRGAEEASLSHCSSLVDPALRRGRARHHDPFPPMRVQQRATLGERVGRSQDLPPTRIPRKRAVGRGGPGATRGAWTGSKEFRGPHSCLGVGAGIPWSSLLFTGRIRPRRVISTSGSSLSPWTRVPSPS